MAGAFYIVKNSGDITNNTLSSLSAVCYFHVTAIVGLVNLVYLSSQTNVKPQSRVSKCKQ